MGKIPLFEEVIDQKVGNFRTESFDLSLADIINLFRESPREFGIPTELQSSFRWSPVQQSRLIESILLEVPIPQIFVMEGPKGSLELFDGIQRVSSVIRFIDASILPAPQNTPLILEGCDIVPELNGMSFESLSPGLRERIRQFSIRTVALKRQNSANIRCAMFKRLNMTGPRFSRQEIRDLICRMAGPAGKEVSQFLHRCASLPEFMACTAGLFSLEPHHEEELVLRVLALKIAENLCRGRVQDWLDHFLEEVIFGRLSLDWQKEEAEFQELFRFIHQAMREQSFLQYCRYRPVGSPDSISFEAMAIGIWHALPKIRNIPLKRVQQELDVALKNEELLDLLDSGDNNWERMQFRITIVENALTSLCQG